MSKEPDANGCYHGEHGRFVSPPGSVPLRDYVERQWHDHAAVHAAEEYARSRAVASMDARLDGMNEFRSSLNDVISKTLSREAYETRHQELDRRIQSVERNMVRQETIDANTAELARTRRTLAYTIAGGIVITVVAAGVDILIRLSGGG